MDNSRRFRLAEREALVADLRVVLVGAEAERRSDSSPTRRDPSNRRELSTC